MNGITKKSPPRKASIILSLAVFTAFVSKTVKEAKDEGNYVLPFLLMFWSMCIWGFVAWLAYL